MTAGFSGAFGSVGLVGSTILGSVGLTGSFGFCGSAGLTMASVFKILELNWNHCKASRVAPKVNTYGRLEML